MTCQITYESGIFAKEEMEQSSIFGYAIDRLNADQSMLARSRIQTHLALIDPDDSFHGEKKVLLIDPYNNFDKSHPRPFLKQEKKTLVVGGRLVTGNY
ncbi:hypothetical protein BLOT_015101 [Blomia tropicalis]|nr:hypothetical protein BLOT_015101 [Blomia tropicalis]